MTLVRFFCEEWATHDSILLSVPDATYSATLGMVTVPCPECDGSTTWRKV